MKAVTNVTDVTNVTGTTQKLCVFCIHLEYEGIHDMALSEVTFETEGGFTCKKNHFFEDQERPDSIEEFRELIVKAQNCPDYDQVKP